jgi:putative ABC transport system substrate-binding protein
MRRRNFIAGGTSAAAVSRVAAQPAAGQRLAIFSPAEPSALMHERSDNRYDRRLFDELRRLGHVEGQNLTVEKYGNEQNTSGPATLAAEVIRSNPDIVYVVGPGAGFFQERKRQDPGRDPYSRPDCARSCSESGPAGRQHHRGQRRFRPIDSWQADCAVT